MTRSQVRMLVRKTRAGGASVPLKLAQMIMLFSLRGIGPGYFLLARFWRREIPFRKMLQHHSASRYRAQINNLNHPAFQKLSQHKLAEKALLSLHGLPTPRYIGFYHKERGADTEGRALRTANELDALLRRYVDKRICFKKAEGSGGSSFSALDVVQVGPDIQLRHPISKKIVSSAELARELETFRSGSIIEEFLVQHPSLSALNPDSVNTLRLIVLRTPSGFVTRGAMLRVGRAGSQVDNTSHGGFACPIDVSTGRIREALDLTLERETHVRHPDSGATLKGFEIPHWQSCLDVANQALACIPRMNFAGIDIAVSEYGPSIIELNVDPDRRFAAHMDLPHTPLFAEFTNANS